MVGGLMMKTEVGAKNCLYPMPTTLVGALVNEKPNYITIAHVGIMDPGSVSLGMNKVHHTNAGIKENETFSINIPSTEMVKKTDYCGLVSGRDKDKAALFKTFYGKLKTAPMIEECPINMECRLIKTVDFPSHDIFIGQIVATYCDEAILTDGIVDFRKVQPILFVMNDRSYWMLGTKFAKAWNIGKELKTWKQPVKRTR
jgi:flavin reductase (DIM6/NTAB) family NADH-FMN oxidoreductase RutF